jgi:type I restriction enzyme S subunit
MIDTLKPYPAYKDSTLPWLATIPAHWEIRRNGRLFAQRNETGFPELPILEVSLRTGVRVRDFDTSSRKQVMSDRDKYKCARRGDIAYNMMRMWQGAVGAAPVDGLISPAYVVGRPLPGTQTRYYEYVFRTDAYMNEVNRFSRGIVSDRNRLYWEDFKQMPSLFPPTAEQALIARFLDHLDRRVRRYIRAKRRIIDLLSEQKQAIIHRAVTRGLDASVRLKPSGVEWLGDVPEHWKVCRLKTLLHKIDQGISPQAEARLADDGAWAVLKSGCVNHGVFRETEHKRLPVGFVVDEELAVHEGDVLVSRACGSPRLVGSVGRVDRLHYRLILSDKTFRLVFREPMLVEFAVAAMNSRCFRLQVEQAISGAEGLANNLPLSSLRDFVLAVPPPEEARKIASAVDTGIGRIGRLAAATEREILSLSEYRTRLVAAIVTGTLDVREAAVCLPDEQDEMEPGDDADVLVDGDDDIDADAVPEEADA